MNRNESLKELRESDQWDIVIIGGGASGLGAVVDAAKEDTKHYFLKKMILRKELLREAPNWFMVGSAIFKMVIFRL